MLDESILDVDNNYTDFLDENGRFIRWSRVYEKLEHKYKKTICGTKMERIVPDIEAEAALGLFNEDLYERLDARRRAISNWKRLKIVIVILKMCNGHFHEQSIVKTDIEE